MKHWKELLVAISISMILGWIILPLVQYGSVLDDPEFDVAKVWAKSNGFEHIEHIEDYPFSVMTRVESVQWYLRVMDLLEKQPLRETCSFSDIQVLEWTVQEEIIRSCTLNVFLGDGGEFNPDRYMTKATALVALMRSLRPEIEHPMENMYWTPYANDAYSLGISKRPSNEYLEYPITRYELLLLLYRGYVECRSKSSECK